MATSDRHHAPHLAMTSFERYERFLALHQAPGLFVMPNAWDGMSALLLREAGFQALGSSSIAIAFAPPQPLRAPLPRAEREKP